MKQPIYIVRYGEPCPDCSNVILIDGKHKDCTRCYNQGYLWIEPPNPVSVLVWKDADTIEKTEDYVLLAFRPYRQTVAVNLARKANGIWRSVYGEYMPEPLAYAEVTIPQKLHDKVQP